MKKFVFLFALAAALFGTGCAALPPAETTSQLVPLDAQDKAKTAAFQSSVMSLFRRYHPVMVEPAKCEALYGQYPVTIWYEDDTVYISSSCPDKHAGWFASIRKGMTR